MTNKAREQIASRAFRLEKMTTRQGLLAIRLAGLWDMGLFGYF